MEIHLPLELKRSVTQRKCATWQIFSKHPSISHSPKFRCKTQQQSGTMTVRKTMCSLTCRSSWRETLMWLDSPHHSRLWCDNTCKLWSLSTQGVALSNTRLCIVSMETDTRPSIKWAWRSSSPKTVSNQSVARPRHLLSDPSPPPTTIEFTIRWSLNIEILIFDIRV